MRMFMALARFAGAGILLAAVGGASPGGEAPPDEDLARELDAFARELAASSNTVDYFAEGRKPDLVVVTSADVHGEIEPCG